MITGYGEVMRDLPGENTAENIQIIIDEATRLSSLVNDLLDLSKLQSGTMKLQKSVFCITDSFKTILRDMQSSRSRTDIIFILINARKEYL